MFKTEKQAREYVKRLRTMDKAHLVFRIPKGTLAYISGGRFATCAADERADYEAGGAVFVDEETAS